MLKVGKNIILRAAVNQGLIDTSEYNRKIKLFNEYEKNKIQTEILNLNNLKNIIRIKSYNDTSEFTDIADLWKYDYFQDWNIKREIKFVDLFSGAGGIGVGFTMAGMQPIQNFEIFPEANETYAYNFKNLRKIINHDVDENDITELDSKNKLIKMLKSNMPDIIVGGFPCQGFSVSGIRSWNDPRNILYKSMLELVKKINPKIVIMENVLGILSMRNADGELVINEIIKMYQENGYEIDYKVLNSADYGVPQLRKRVIFIANNIGVKNLFPNWQHEIMVI
ncbi:MULTISPECIES: DNA cytosine methyltransferase [unclassified Spiroplasma]|uniref:DNA cytosine methyltransferase n=1 Tax=unclassified Spiroplasma TaxID=2637901 RepID=UPI001E3B0248|nr:MULTISPECIES: DNA (cytosine-5-)-methyltransferase [unclassified Spiroplasma]